MASSIRILRRLNGAAGSPPAAQALEGMLAVNIPGAAGGTAKPELYVADGQAWRHINPDSAVTVGSVSLPGGTSGSATGIGAAWTAFALKPTTSIVVADFAGTAYIKTGAGNLDAHWTPMGAATNFATVTTDASGLVLQGDFATPRSTSTAVTPASLYEYLHDWLSTSGNAAVNAAPDPNHANFIPRLNAAGHLNTGLLNGTNTPDATPANDANRVPVLNAQGKIDAGFLTVKAVTFVGAVDVTQAASVPATMPATGSFALVSATGAPDAAWAAVIQGTHASLDAGDLLISDGTKFHVVEHDVDLSAYLALSGGTMAANANVQWPGAVNAEAGNVLLNLKGGTIDNSLIDGGTY